MYFIEILHTLKLFCENWLNLIWFWKCKFKLFIFYRSVLDFDFEKLCSVSLSHLNVYACLVCGKYFQGLFLVCFLVGFLLTKIDLVLYLRLSLLICMHFFSKFIMLSLGRGQNSHAYTHSVHIGHHVYLNLHTLKVRNY